MENLSLKNTFSFREEMMQFSNEFHGTDSSLTLATITSNLNHCLGLVPEDSIEYYKLTRDYFDMLYHDPDFDVEQNAIDFWELSNSVKLVFLKHQNLFGCNVAQFVIAYIEYKHARILENKIKNRCIIRLYGS